MTSAKKYGKRASELLLLPTFPKLLSHGYKGVEVAEALSLKFPTVGRNIEKGEFLFKNRKLGIKVKIT